MGSFLDGGGDLFISSQDYFFDRGQVLTAFMSNYLGVGSATNDVGQATATGAGTPFSGLGPYTLSYPFINHSDALHPTGSAEVAFTGDQGSAGVDKAYGKYHTAYLGFPFEALPSAAARVQVMRAFLNWCFKRIFMPVISRP